MSITKFELWVGVVRTPEGEQPILALACEGEQGFLTLTPDEVTPLVAADTPELDRQEQALALAITYYTVQLNGGIWYGQWTDILDRKLSAMFEIETAQLEEIVQDYWKECPHVLEGSHTTH